MRLGTDTGSLINHLYSRGIGSEPEIGMGATLLLWTDRHGATITDIFQVGQTTYIEVREDRAKIVGGNMLSEHQEYEYTPDPDAQPLYFRRHRNGGWQQTRRNPGTGRWIKVNGYGLIVGRREEYRDPSF